MTNGRGVMSEGVGGGACAGALGDIEFVVMSENFAPNASAARRAAIADGLLSATAVLKVPRPDCGTKDGSAGSRKRGPETRSSANDEMTWLQIITNASSNLDAMGSIA